MELTFTSWRSSREGLGSRVVLNNGTAMPWLGLGVYKMKNDEQTADVVLQAIDAGYRSIDTAAIYGNERGVGRAIKEASVPREDLFVTTKVWNDDMRKNRVAEAFEESMDRLGLDYIDMLLLHWPIEGKIADSWLALQPFYETGRIKALGVSNFLPQHIDELAKASNVLPVVNQIEYHPYLQSRDLKTFCDSKDILLEAWSPFMAGGSVLSDGELARIGNKHGKSSAQVILRWILQTGVATIPKTASSKRLIENASIFDFSLDDADMLKIAALERAERSGPDPAHFDF